MQVRLQRERLELSPVYSTAVVHHGRRLGFIRLVNFSQHAAADMQRAVTQLQVRPLWLIHSPHCCDLQATDAAPLLGEC